MEETENKGTENQDLEQTPPASESAFSEKAIETISGLRKRSQAAELRAERAEGVAEGMQQVAAKAEPPAVSPLDAHIAKQVADGVDEEDVTISPSLYRRQKVFETQVANKETAAMTTKVHQDAQFQSIRDTKLIHDDWDETIAAGESNLTKGELVDLQDAGDNYGELAYAKCKAATERAKPKTEKPAPETKPGEPETKVEAKKPEPATRQEILDAAGDPGIAAVMEL